MTVEIVEADSIAEGLAASAAKARPRCALDRLRKFAVTEEHVHAMAETRLIWRSIIAHSHLAVWSAPAGAGKTTIARMAAAELAATGFDVMFFQEDAPAGDLPAMHDHATRGGYTLLNSVLSGASVEDQVQALRDLVESAEDLGNTVLFFDTLKKFADLMSKGGSREFFRLMRALTTRGATVVLLGHTNKHRGPDGKLVFEGVGDVRNDVDELVYLESTERDADGKVIATMKPDKVRCAAKEISFRIDTRDLTVHPLPQPVDTAGIVRRQQQMRDDAEVIESIRSILRQGGMPKFTLVERLVSEAGIGDRTARAVVNRYAGTDPADTSALWIETFIRTNNARHIALRPQ